MDNSKNTERQTRLAGLNPQGNKPMSHENLSRRANGYDGIVTAGMVDAIDRTFGGPPALTPEKAALHDRLAARLVLSEAHVSERERVSDEIGLTAIYKKMDKVADQWSSIELRIEAARPKSISDLRLKLELYDNNPSDKFAQYLLRDMRKALATAA